jgi:putative toxin-antitoxin system antitoxin component (TIGR02293 family)
MNKKSRQPESASIVSDLSVEYERSGTVLSVLAHKSQQEKINLIRQGLPYEIIEEVGQQGGYPVKRILAYLGLAQTTYNKRKRERARLTVRESEIIVTLSELLQYGLSVFNDEQDKFHRWLNKENRSLGGLAPSSLFDTIMGIREVKNALDRMEYGNMS